MPQAMAIVLLEEGQSSNRIEIKEDGKPIEVEEIKKLTPFFANNVNISLALN